MSSNAHAPKPYQLECSTDRDNLHRWWSILTNYGRREETMQFYPGGEFHSWTAECRDLTRGIPAVQPKVEDDANPSRIAELAAEAVKATTKRRNSLANLLTIFASFTPPGTFQTITSEATSLTWIFKRVAKLCNIQIGGRHLVNAWTLKWDKQRETPDVFFLRLRSATAECLMPAGSKYHEEVLTHPEVFTPLSESLLTIRWLDGIHPRLAQHIAENRASLFTSDKPNFADIQPDLCDIMDTLLAELEQTEGASSVSAEDDVSISRIFSQWKHGRGSNRGGYGGRGGRGGRPSSSISPWNNSSRTPAVDKLCNHCKVLNKSPAIYQSHSLNECFDLFPEKRRSVGVRILNIPVHVNEDDEFDPEEAAAFLEACKLNKGLVCGSYSDQQESSSEVKSQ